MEDSQRKLLAQIGVAWTLLDIANYVARRDIYPDGPSTQLASGIADEKALRRLLSISKERYNACKVVVELDVSNTEWQALLFDRFFQSVFELCEVLQIAGWIGDSLMVSNVEAQHAINRFFPVSIETMTVNEWEGGRSASAKLVARLIKHFDFSTVYGTAVVFAIRILSTVKFPRVELPKNIVREIIFTPETQQAGIGILNYFSVVLNEKYPDLNVAVSIRQDGQKVTMTITHPDGSEEAITKTLADYGLVVTGVLKPRDLLSNANQALALQNKLDLATLEIKFSREMLVHVRSDMSARIESLESQVQKFHELFGQELSMRKSLQDGLLRALEANRDDMSKQWLVDIVDKLATAIESKDETNVREIVQKIQFEEPDIFSKLSYFVLKNGLGGIAGGAGYDWLKLIWPIAP